MKAKRANLEQEILSKFIKVAKKHRYVPISGQGNSNRIRLAGNIYFQFGDLRVETESRQVAIEVETAGGVTNLVKYWYCLSEAQEQIRKPIVLLHIFRTHSENDYGSHLLLWDYLYDRMTRHLRNCIQARRFKFDDVDPLRDELDDALKYFEKMILEK